MAWGVPRWGVFRRLDRLRQDHAELNARHDQLSADYRALIKRHSDLMSRYDRCAQHLADNPLLEQARDALRRHDALQYRIVQLTEDVQRAWACAMQMQGAGRERDDARIDALFRRLHDAGYRDLGFLLSLDDDPDRWVEARDIARAWLRGA